jgi:threonine dehydrogenase-like Zn-dependent dehydrogenase
VRTWGTACFVGEGGDVTLTVSQDLLRRQVTLIGSWTFSSVGQMDCAAFIAERRIPLEETGHAPLQARPAAEAYRLFDTQTTGKGVFLF